MGWQDEDDTESIGWHWIVNETARAVLVRNVEGDERWIPKSVIVSDLPPVGEASEIDVKQWWSDKNP